MMHIYAYKGDRCVFEGSPAECISPGQTQAMIRTALLAALVDRPENSVVTIHVGKPQEIEID